MNETASIMQQKSDLNRNQLLQEFVESNPEYYQQQFKKINDSTQFVWTFNWVASLLGPIWYGFRGLWKYGLPFVLIETFGLAQITRGLFGDLAIQQKERIALIQNTLNLRQKQLESALESGSDKVESIRSWVSSLQQEINNVQIEIQQIEASAIWVIVSGLLILLTVKIVEGLCANVLLERRFSQWLSQRTLSYGLKKSQILISTTFVLFVFLIAILHYGLDGNFSYISSFPSDSQFRLTVIDWIVAFFDFLTDNGGDVFFFISYIIRTFLDYLEILFVETPWPIVASFIILLTGLTAGIKGALFAAASLAFMGVFQFWEKAMTTLALLGTAACISIILGIPLGVYCSRRDRFYNVIRPIMDFMQTMPSFVFMIPVIALFSVGKPAAIVITMIFGGTPVVRMTVLGLRGVPESIREAAISYGATKWYLLTKVDLPLAMPSLLAGINQTIMLSLAMVVVASLIGAKGLGQDVLEALQYSNVGQGILAGLAILFCAMILNRIIQGKNR